MQITVRTNILLNTSSKNDLRELLKRSVDSDKYIKQVTQMPHPLKSENLFTLCRGWTHLINEILLESHSKDRGSRHFFSNSSVAGSNCGIAAICSAHSAECESSWLWGSRWDVDVGPWSCASESTSVQPTVLRCMVTTALSTNPCV